MADWPYYALYDYKRDRFTNHFGAENDDVAMAEFEYLMNTIPKDWEKRDIGRWTLWQIAFKGYDYVPLSPYRLVMSDFDARFDPHIYYLKDPFYDDVSEAEYHANVARILDAEQRERNERGSNLPVGEVSLRRRSDG